MIDDDPAAFQLQPHNAIRISTFSDAHNKSDTALEDLIPFLAAIVNEGVDDIPALIRSFESNDAEVVAQSYNSKVSRIKVETESIQHRGLGGILRSVSDSTSPIRVDELVVADSLHNFVGRPEIKAGTGPLEAEHKGGLWKRIESMKKEAEEQNRKKMEAFNEVMMKKERDRTEK